MNIAAELHATADDGETVTYQRLGDGSDRWTGTPEAIRRVRDTLLVGADEVIVAMPDVSVPLSPGEDRDRSLDDVYLALLYSTGVRARVEVISGSPDGINALFSDDDDDDDDDDDEHGAVIY